jgi:hypothetical protein
MLLLLERQIEHIEGMAVGAFQAEGLFGQVRFIFEDHFIGFAKLAKVDLPVMAAAMAFHWLMLRLSHNSLL